MKISRVLLLMLWCFHSCTPVSFEDNKRLEITGNVHDTQGSGIENLEVAAQTYISDFGFFSRGPDLGNINTAHTNSNGDFSFISLDVNPGKLVIKFEPESDFQSLTYMDTRNRREESLIDLGTVILRKRKRVTLEFQPAENFEGEITYSIRFWNPDPVITITNWETLTENPESEDYSKFRTYEGRINANEEGLYRLSIRTLENTEMEVQYDFDSFLNEDSPEVVIPIEQDTDTYEIPE